MPAIFKHTAPLPPQSISLSKILPGPQFVFNWTRVVSPCQTIDYIIRATADCGNCPTSTVVNEASCTNVPAGIVDRNCSFAVITRVCGTVEGADNKQIFVRLKGE